MATDVIKISNFIRQNASDTYKNKVAVLNDSSSIDLLANPLMTYSTAMNEYATGLINVIGMTIINRISNFENPLSKFKKGTTGLGIDVREIARGLVDSKKYEFTTEGIANMFKIYPQEYAECFHRLNRQEYYPITFSEKELKLALNSWDDLTAFIEGITETLYQSNYMEEYELTKELLRLAMQNDNIKRVEISAVTDSATGDDFIETVKNVSSSFNYRNANNSVYGRLHPDTKILPVCSKDDIALILPYTVKNKLSVSTLAGAFNKDELAFNVDTVTEVDDLGFIRLGDASNYKYYAIDAIICDKNYIRIIDDEDNGVNGNDLPTARAYNRYLHIWQTLSTSPFMCVNALVHEVQLADIPNGYFD